MDALRKWKMASAHLNDSIQAFFESCVALESAISNPVAPATASLTDRASLENMILHVRSELHSIESVASKLCSSRSYINKILNMSTTLVPLAALPPEVLSHIFALATSSSACVGPNCQKDMMIVIPSVCTSWQRVSLGTSSLWSHIDITCMPSAGRSVALRNHIRRRVERAGNTSLELHVHHTRDGTDIAIFDELCVLESRPDSLISLDIYLAARNVTSTEHLFQRLLSLGALNSVKLLRFACRDVGGGTGVEWPWKAFLPSSALTIEELAEMLSRNPNLRVLKLQGLPSSALFTLRPISLPYLSLLDLTHNYHSTIVLLLSALMPGVGKLDLRLDIPLGTGAIEASLMFLQRSTVNSLYARMCQTNSPAWFTRCLSLLPHLRMFYLEMASDQNASSYGASIITIAESVAANCPMLHTACLYGIAFDDFMLQYLEEPLSIPSLRKIFFVSCDLSNTWSMERKIERDFSGPEREAVFTEQFYPNEAGDREAFLQARLMAIN
ncbi:hypothetical protein BDV93DRAFT_561895 [Ceratobasidium sp. AG-I]|nr:hypothetical protein BDV93DRAFT_561895 [Ceratobasidium sp. AG-I]